MRKILTLLLSSSILFSTTSSVIACGNNKFNTIHNISNKIDWDNTVILTPTVNETFDSKDFQKHFFSALYFQNKQLTVDDIKHISIINSFNIKTINNNKIYKMVLRIKVDESYNDKTISFIDCSNFSYYWLKNKNNIQKFFDKPDRSNIIYMLLDQNLDTLTQKILQPILFTYIKNMINTRMELSKRMFADSNGLIQSKNFKIFNWKNDFEENKAWNKDITLKCGFSEDDNINNAFSFKVTIYLFKDTSTKFTPDKKQKTYQNYFLGFFYKYFNTHDLYTADKKWFTQDKQYFKEQFLESKDQNIKWFTKLTNFTIGQTEYNNLNKDNKTWTALSFKINDSSITSIHCIKTKDNQAANTNITNVQNTYNKIFNTMTHLPTSFNLSNKKSIQNINRYSLNSSDHEWIKNDPKISTAAIVERGDLTSPGISLENKNDLDNHKPTQKEYFDQLQLTLNDCISNNTISLNKSLTKVTKDNIINGFRDVNPDVYKLYYYLPIKAEITTHITSDKPQYATIEFLYNNNLFFSNIINIKYE